MHYTAKVYLTTEPFDPKTGEVLDKGFADHGLIDTLKSPHLDILASVLRKRFGDLTEIYDGALEFSAAEERHYVNYRILITQIEETYLDVALFPQLGGK
jgi:hypothetical protein